MIWAAFHAGPGDGTLVCHCSRPPAHPAWRAASMRDGRTRLATGFVAHEARPVDRCHLALHQCAGSRDHPGRRERVTFPAETTAADGNLEGRVVRREPDLMRDLWKGEARNLAPRANLEHAHRAGPAEPGFGGILAIVAMSVPLGLKTRRWILNTHWSCSMCSSTRTSSPVDELKIFTRMSRPPAASSAPSSLKARLSADRWPPRDCEARRWSASQRARSASARRQQPGSLANRALQGLRR